jgi:asparagine synthase (glutamine-hydrolysing)
MCGIAGIIGMVDAIKPLEKMLDILVQRGRNDRGKWVDPLGNAALGHIRLSIIDLDTAGQEAMTHDEGCYWVTIKWRDLQQLGIALRIGETRWHFGFEHRNRRHSRCVYELGLEFLKRLGGMFAFAF